LWGGRVKAKLLFLILLPPLLYALILTMSRGALLALLVVCWIIFKSANYKALLVTAFIGIAIAAWSVMSDIQKDRYLSLIDSDTASSSTVDGRFSGMANEFVLGMTSRPIFGNGLGTTAEAKFNTWGKGKASHNLYAELLIEIGLVGGIIFLLFIKSIWRQLKQLTLKLNSVKNVDTFWQSLNLSMFSIFWMYAVYSINYYGLSQYYWYMFGGLVVSFRRIVEREQKTNA
jgi:O-antigen ligase